MKSEKVTRGRERVYDDACGTALALEFVGERWSLLIMRELVYGPRRFGEIRANLPGISANVLTQRLEHLAGADILRRRQLPSPANVQVYELTAWGLSAAPLIRDLGHWAAQSPRHDPLLFMSAASAMMSLDALVDRAALADFPPTTIGFVLPDDAFGVRAGGGELTVARGQAAGAEVTFTGDTMALRHTIYGKRGTDTPETLAMRGDKDRAQAFLDLFRLPEKITARG
jgi:DNA-binding HxlR family transcriptional regulator